jgi:hypothetical protein
MKTVHAIDKLAPALVSFVVTCVFFINFCAWVFQCGCHSLWAGADAACNVHALQGPHCPWCARGGSGYVMVMTLICAPQFAVAALTTGNRFVRTVVALAVGSAAGLATALAFGWYDNYW